MGYKKMDTIMPPHISDFEKRVGNTNGIPAKYRNMSKNNSKSKKVKFNDEVKSRTYVDSTCGNNSENEEKIQGNNKIIGTYVENSDSKLMDGKMPKTVIGGENENSNSKRTHVRSSNSSNSKRTHVRSSDPHKV